MHQSPRIIPEELVPVKRVGKLILNGVAPDRMLLAPPWRPSLLTTPTTKLDNSTKLFVFGTEVVDLTEELHDPVDVLFGTQLRGGTDINRAVGYCQPLITRPAQTIFVLIFDLIEGGVEAQLLRRTAEIIQ